MIENKQNYRKALIVVSIISLIIILGMGSTIHSLNGNIDYYNKNYQYVPEGKTSFYCESNQQYLCYDRGEYAMNYDPKTENVAKCNALQNQQATCVTAVNGQANYAQCQNNQFPACIDETASWTSCSTGFQAVCADKTKTATWDGNWLSSCPIGYSAYCTKN